MAYSKAAALFFTSLFAVTGAVQSPQYGGYTRIWQETFTGSAGQLPSSSNWVIVESTENFNNELQEYTSSKNNVQLSGSGTLQIIPHGDKSAPNGWTSGRIESKYLLTPAAGKITNIEASLRLSGGAASSKQGIWPAFWILGDSYRHGVLWPACGEIDIFENINGQSLGYATLHCSTGPGGICNEPSGLSSSTALADNKFHTWRIKIDRTESKLADQSIVWYLDSKEYFRVMGSQISSVSVWQSLTQKPFFFVLNVAIGGDWAGPPNSQTVGGSGSMMEVQYVAHYVSN